MIQEFLHLSLTTKLVFSLLLTILFAEIALIFYRFSKTTERKTMQTMDQFLLTVPSGTIIRILFLGHRDPETTLVKRQIFLIQILEESHKIASNASKFKVIRDVLLLHRFDKNRPAGAGRFDFDAGTFTVTHRESSTSKKQKPILTRIDKE